MAPDSFGIALMVCSFVRLRLHYSDCLNPIELDCEHNNARRADLCIECCEEYLCPVHHGNASQTDQIQMNPSRMFAVKCLQMGSYSLSLRLSHLLLQVAPFE